MQYLETSGPLDDPFRVAILRSIMAHPEEALVRFSDMDAALPAHELFKDGKPLGPAPQPTLRQLGKSALGAGGVTIPSRSLALQDALYSGPVTGVPNQSWILYSTPESLAHEFGHLYLLFSGAPWEHGKAISKTAGVKAPSGSAYEGPVNEFIGQDVAEVVVDILDPQSPHFSPTVVRQWPEPPDFKPTFTGTWLEFLAKYPGSKAKEKRVETPRGTRRTLEICVPSAGQICF
jgi:hypothetical protein